LTTPPRIPRTRRGLANPGLALYGDGALAHQDLTYARWEHNRFIRTLASFLQTLPGGKR
jgi:hypothetical protein